MHKLILFLVFGISLSAFSQMQTLKGEVEVNSESVLLTQVVVYSLPDSVLVKGAYLDSSLFELSWKEKSATEFYIKISCPSYSDTLIPFQFSNSEFNLGKITLTKSEVLETVDIVYKKEMFIRTLDGISVNVEGTNLQTLTNLYEVLKASPKINSPDGEIIEIIGKGAPLIFVDRQAIISNDELKAIPASQIERIEIITNPSAKYRAQGGANGVIEVYTKSFRLEGYNLTVSANGGLNTQLMPSANMSIGLSVKRKKLTVSGNLGGNFQQNKGYGSSIGETTDGSNRETNSNFDFIGASFRQFYQIKSAYAISRNQRISMGINGYGSLGGNSNLATMNFFDNDTTISTSSSVTGTKYTWLNNTAFINYSVDTDTNKSHFEVNLNYVNKVTTNEGNSQSDFNNLLINEQTNFARRTYSRDIPNIAELRINYEHVFDTTGWKFGIGGDYSLLVNNKKYDQFNSVNNEWVIDSIYSNSYDYQEQIGSFFVEVTKNWEKIGFRTGVRAEYTNLYGYSNSLKKQFMDSSYILPFPTASILFQPTEKVGITLAYSSGVNRPQFSNFDPFVKFQDSLSINYGNPYLLPGIKQSLSLEFDLFYTYNISIGYTYLKDPTSTLSFISESTFIRESTPWNALNDQGFNLNVSAPIRSKWLKGWNSIWVNYTYYSFTPEFERDNFLVLTFGLYSSLAFTLPKRIELMSQLNVHKWGGASSISNVNVNWTLRLTKKFTKNDFQLFGEVANIFPPKARSTSFSGNYVYQLNSQNLFTTFKVGLFIKVGRLKGSVQVQESTSGQSGRI
jgi:hypothetical protein